MATRYIDKINTASGATAVANDTAGTRTIQNLPDAAGIVFDVADDLIKYNDADTIRTIIAGNPAVVSATGALTVSAITHSGRSVVLNAAAGGTVTLPAASGSGTKLRFVVGTTITSASWVFDVTGNDTYFGGVLINDTGDTTAATVDFHAAASGNNRITLAQSVGAAKKGDWIELEDVAADSWAVHGMLQGELDPTNPFSTA